MSFPVPRFLSRHQIPQTYVLRLLCLIVCVLVSACAQVTLHDDIDVDFDFHVLEGPSDSLHSPYVEGAKLTVFVRSTRSKENYDGWTIESNRPQVFAVQPLVYSSTGSWAAAHAEAMAPGVATLTVRARNGEILSQSDVEVKRPDRIALLAHGLLLVDTPESQAQIPEPRIVEKGMATFLVRYFSGVQQLSGNGALSVQAPAGVVAAAVPTYIFENRDWLQIASTTVGPASLQLLVHNVPVMQQPIQIVPATDARSLQILGRDERRYVDGDSLVALAQAKDAQGRLLFGVEYKWELEGVAQSGLGDLFRYALNRATVKVLSAHMGQLMADAEIHAVKGVVSSSNHIGCGFAATAASRAQSSSGVLILGVLLLGLVRRRRAELC